MSGDPSIRYQSLPPGTVIRIVSKKGNLIRVRILFFDSERNPFFNRLAIVEVLEAPQDFDDQVAMLVANLTEPMPLGDVTDADMINCQSPFLRPGSIVMLARTGLEVASVGIE